LLPSVTAITKLWPSDNLRQWLRGRDIIAALTTPRNGEPDEEWIARVIECADEESERARSIGTRRHDILHRLHKENYLDTTTRDYPYLEPYILWLREHVDRIQNAEYITVNKAMGYAGTVDVRCVLLDGRTALLDVKNRKRLQTYFEDAMQLVSYSQAERSQGNSVDTVISVVLGTEKPEIHVNEWLAVDEPWECFQLLLKLWTKSKNYYPAAPVAWVSVQAVDPKTL